jgi:DNA-binding FadR family transcriptional regulator
MESLAFSTCIDLGRNISPVRELREIREILERDLIARAADIVTLEQLAALTAIVDRMTERGERGEMFTNEDRAFHELLYQQLGNSMVVQLLRAFWDVFFAVRDALPGRQADVLAADGHRAIAAAFARRDRAAASAAMTAHFARIQQRLAAPFCVSGGAARPRPASMAPKRRRRDPGGASSMASASQSLGSLARLRGRRRR